MPESRIARSVQTLALITPAGAHAADQAARVVALAKQAGVQKIVRLSAIKASGAGHNTRQHGINLLGSLQSIVGEGKLYPG